MSERLAGAWLDEAATRTAQKRLGAELDARGPAEKARVVEAARARGVDLPDEAASWPGKKLLRRGQGRAGVSQVRTNPIARDEAFQCIGCGREVPPHGRTARDHCPFCLVGRHVDDTAPGDRASPCGGRLDPVSVDREGDRWILVYRCATCGVTRRNQVLRDGDPADDWARVTELAGRA